MKVYYLQEQEENHDYFLNDLIKLLDLSGCKL